MRKYLLMFLFVKVTTFSELIFLICFPGKSLESFLLKKQFINLPNVFR